MIDSTTSPCRHLDLEKIASAVRDSRSVQELQHQHESWSRRRRFRNAYREECVKVWDDDDIPLSLDLHGFTREPAAAVLREFLDFVEKWDLPAFGVIFGSGEVLCDVVWEELYVRSWTRSHDVSDGAGYVHVSFETRDIAAPSAALPVVIRPAAAAPVAVHTSPGGRPEPAREKFGVQWLLLAVGAVLGGGLLGLIGAIVGAVVGAVVGERSTSED